MVERLMAAVLKTAGRNRAPGVRIPLPPDFAVTFHWASIGHGRQKHTIQCLAVNKVYKWSKEPMQRNSRALSTLLMMINGL